MSNHLFSSKFIKLVPAFWACIFDVFITAINQPKAYWEGNLSIANEGNPIGNLFMTSHYSGLFVIAAIELIVIGLLYSFLPNKIRRIFLLFVVVAHSAAVASWLFPLYGFWSVMFLALFNATLYIVVEDIKAKKT